MAQDSALADESLVRKVISIRKSYTIADGFAPGRKSHKASSWGEFSDMALKFRKSDDGSDQNDSSNYAYMEVIAEAKMCVGHGADAGAFPEEWDAQLLVDAGRTSEGHRLVIFTPAFLKPVLHDEHELDRAFKFVLLCMDSIAMREKFVFVYCYQGLDWSSTSLNHRLMVAYDIIPRRYAKHLRRFVVLHPTAGFRVLLWSFWPWLTSRLWAKIEYAETLDELCHRLGRHELRRRFPQLVQRQDAALQGLPPPATFGVPLGRVCADFGVDFTDRTTGRWYPRLPPALVFLCEALERQAADEALLQMFEAEAAAVYDLVSAIDVGEPLDPEAPLPALWCALKLFLDCLPQPLLGDVDAELPLPQLLAQASPDSRHVALYLSSFLHTMVRGSQRRGGALSFELVAEVFAPCILRPKAGSGSATVTALLAGAEDTWLWD